MAFSAFSKLLRRCDEAVFFESCKRNYECIQSMTKPYCLLKEARRVKNCWLALGCTSNKVIEHVKIFTSLEKNRKHNRKPHYAFTQNNLTGY